MGKILIALAADETGVSGVEYAILGSLVALAIAGELFSVGNEVRDQYEFVDGQYHAATNG